MRTHLLPIAALLLLNVPTKAQILAGEVPSGMSAVDVGINILLPVPNTTNSATFEVDCDDQPDMMVTLVHGQPAVDAPNIAMLQLLDDDLELCADLANFQRPKYHAFGEVLDCSGDFDWQSDSVNTLGDFGSWTAIGPLSMDSMYVAYRRGEQVGWILLSFDLAGDVVVRLHIHQVLPICPASTSLAEDDLTTGVVLFPDPSNGQLVQMQCSGALQGIEVLDSAGRLLARYGGTARMIMAPDVPGTYIVRLSHSDGRRSSTRLVRY